MGFWFWVAVNEVIGRLLVVGFASVYVVVQGALRLAFWHTSLEAADPPGGQPVPSPRRPVAPDVELTAG